MAALGNLSLDFKADRLVFSLSHKSSDDVILSGVLGTAIPRNTEYDLDRKDKCIVVQFKGTGTLSVSKSEEELGTRYDVEWELASPGKRARLVDVIDMSAAHWYGAAQVRNQQWPIEKWSRPISAFVCGDSFIDQYGGVQERYWLSSNGIAVFVDEDSPLFVGMNENRDSKLRLVSKFEKPYKNVHNRNLYLKYAIYHSRDVKAVHQMVAKQRLAPPTCIPDELMFRHPIWSTWAKYKTKISQQIVIEYAKEISRQGFKSCQIEIDDDWTPTYGDMNFDQKKFPDPGVMVATLKEMGHRVTLWVHPFASPWSKACFNGVSQCWVRSGMLPGVTKWWNGIARHLDVTNPAATQWFKDSLRKLQQDYQITSFKFDAGEVNLLPPAFRLYKEVQNPNIFTKRYAELACEVDSEVRCHEVRVGWRTQHLPVFVRMMDKDSNWGFDNGLKTLIPHALTFSLLGYPFILPDMIGGNAYKTEYPERELFIRWLQVTALMPALQFSITPWTYDVEVVEISRSMCDLHASFTDYIIGLAKECVVGGDPIIRPLWWINPGDDVTLAIDSEFLVGNRLLVAPVLERGARKRDVYIPLGKWRDQLNGELIEGPVWMRGYKAEIDQLPHFVLESGKGGKLGREKWDEKVVCGDRIQGVGGDRVQWLGGDRVQEVGGDRVQGVGGDRVQEVCGDREQEVCGDRVQEVVGDRVQEVGEDRVQEVGGDRVQEVCGDREQEVGGDRVQEVVGDRVQEVGEDRVQEVGGDRVQEVGGDRVQEASEDRVQEAGGDRVQDVGGDRVQDVGGDRVQEVCGDREQEVGGDRVQEVGGDREQEVGGDRVQEVVGDRVQEVGEDRVQEVGGDRVQEVGGDRVQEASEDRVQEAGGDRVQDVGGDRVQEVGGDRVQEANEDRVQEEGGDRVQDVGGDRVQEVGGDRVQEVCGDREQEVGGDRVQEVVGDRVQEVGEDRVQEVGGDRVQEVGGDRVQEASEDRVQEAGGDRVQDVGGDRVQEVGGDRVQEANEDRVQEEGGDRVQDVGGDRVQEVGGDRVQETGEDRVQGLDTKQNQPVSDPQEQESLQTNSEKSSQESEQEESTSHKEGVAQSNIQSKEHDQEGTKDETLNAQNEVGTNRKVIESAENIPDVAGTDTNSVDTNSVDTKSIDSVENKPTDAVTQSESGQSDIVDTPADIARNESSKSTEQEATVTSDEG